MKKTSSLLLSLFILLAACGPAQPGELLPQEPTIAATTPDEPPATDAPPAPTATPEPLSTSTPLPTPTEVPPQLQIALVNAAGDLLLWQESDSSLAPILTASDALDVRISDDGALIAFRKDVGTGQQEVWVVNTDGTNARLLLGVDALRALDPAAQGVMIYQYEWIPGTHTLAFNTIEYIEAPGQFLNDDLHFLHADTGELTPQLPSGEGGNFVFSPDGQQYALIGFDTEEGVGTVSLYNTDGSNVRLNVLTYPYILTYSEYQYYAQPVWSLDSTFLRVAIPPQDSLGEPEAATLLYEIPTDGTLAAQLGEVLTQPLVGVHYSPDLNRIAYTRLPDPNDFLNAELVIANAGGGEQTVYAIGNLFFQGWSPDSQHFVFEDNALQQTFLGTIGSGNTLFTDFPRVWNVTWLDETRFLFSLQAGSGWQLYLGTLGQPSVLLTDLADGLVQYDFDQ